MPRLGLALIAASLLLSTEARAQLQVEKRLDQIDRTFICPEDLADDEARRTALKLFLQQVASIEPKITIKEVVSYRNTLLRKHGCKQTLANITEASKADEPSPPSSGAHWVNAGRVVSGGQTFTISVDLSTMADAGPGRMRTWIKYRNDKTDAKGVQEWLAYEQLDCARRYHSTISLISYGPDGHVLSNDKGQVQHEDAIIPDSVLAGLLPFTCASHGLKAR